jgi:hypothetical protein
VVGIEFILGLITGVFRLRTFFDPALDIPWPVADSGPELDVLRPAALATPVA